MEVIINSIGDTANEEDGMDDRGGRRVLAVKVASLAATNETAGLGSLCVTLGQFLMWWTNKVNHNGNLDMRQ